MVGIYKIYNKNTGKCYIGESLDIIRRWKDHLLDLKNGKHENFKLQNDYNKYGEDSFEFSTVLLFDDTLLSHKNILNIKILLLIYESKYIIQFDSINNGYNIKNTFKDILEGKDILKIGDQEYKMHPKEFKVRSSNEINSVKNNMIKNFGGILYVNQYSIKNIIDKYKLKSQDFGLMLVSMGIYEFNGRVNMFKINDKIAEKYNVSDPHFNSDKIISSEIFEYICSEIDKVDMKHHIKNGKKIKDEYILNRKNKNSLF